MARKKPVGESYESYCLRHLAKANTETIIHELNRIVTGRSTFDADVVKLEKSVSDCVTLIKKRKLDAQELIDDLSELVRFLKYPPSDSDIIRASDLLLQRGWGRPSTESPPGYERFVGMDDQQAREMVRASMIARAVEGDVTAQQNVLRLPSRIEVLGIGEGNLDASHLTDDEMSTFLGLIEKMRQRSLESKEIEDE